MALIATTLLAEDLHNRLYLGRYWCDIVFRRWLSKNVDEYVFPAVVAAIIEKYFKEDCEIDGFPLLWYPADTMLVTTPELSSSQQLDVEEGKQLIFNNCGYNRTKSTCLALTTIKDTSLKYINWKITASRKNICPGNRFYNVGCVSIPLSLDSVTKIVNTVKTVEAQSLDYDEIFPTLCKLLGTEDTKAWWISFSADGFSSSHYNSFNGPNKSMRCKAQNFHGGMNIYGKVDKYGSFIIHIGDVKGIGAKYNHITKTHSMVMLVTAPVCQCERENSNICKHNLCFRLSVMDGAFDFVHFV